MISKMEWILFAILIFNVAFTSDEKTKINEEPNQELMLKNIYTKEEEKLKVPEECMVCYDYFPVLFQFPCGHEICAVCAESIYKLCDDRKIKCPKCRAPFPSCMAEIQKMIKIYTIHLTPDNSLEKLQIAFPLICSVANLTTVTKFIKMGIDINAQGFLGFFPIHLALQKDVLKYLLGNGTNVSQRKTDGLTPLYMRCLEESLPIVQYLIYKGANVDQPDNDGNTPLHVSSQTGHLLMIKCLVKNGANVNQHNNHDVAPLMLSCQEGHLQVVKYLVENGANVNQPDNNGFTPLHMSSQNWHLPVVKYLVENGANVNQSDNKGFTPLYVSSENGFLSVVKYLVENGANVNQSNEKGFTSLYISSQEGHLPVVKYLVEKLLENGTNVNPVYNHDGVTPLAIAILQNHTEVAKFLLKKNANIKSTKLFFKKNNFSDEIDILDIFCKEEKIGESNHQAKDDNKCFNQ